MSPAVSPFELRARRIRRALRRYPAVQPLVNRIGALLWRRHLARSARSAGEVGTLPTRIAIDPRAISLGVWRQDVLSLGGTTQLRNVAGRVQGGSWDEASFPLARLGIFEAVRQRFEDGAAWEDTAFYREVEQALARGERPFKFQGSADLPRIFEKVDALHATIVREGYRSQEELGTGRPWDEVVVSLDRDGRICFVDGRHRLAVARVLGLQSIPAVVALRHRRWVQRVMEVRSYVRERGGRSYQPYLHPDLRDLPSDQGHERFEMLLDALPIRSGALVDLGANAGYFCHRFEEVGFDCIAVERSEKELHFLTALRDASGREFRIAKGSLTEVELPPKVDVVLALNIFHHFLKTEDAFRELGSFLRRLRARYMLFQAHLPGDPQMADAAHDMAPADFVRWVREQGGFESVTEIGRAADGRPIFLLAAGAVQPAGAP